MIIGVWMKKFPFTYYYFDHHYNKRFVVVNFFFKEQAFSIKEAVALYGINNIRIFGATTPFSIVMPHMGIGLKNHNDEQFRTEFFIIEERYQVKDGYKIKFKLWM